MPIVNNAERCLPEYYRRYVYRDRILFRLFPFVAREHSWSVDW